MVSVHCTIFIEHVIKNEGALLRHWLRVTNEVDYTSLNSLLRYRCLSEKKVADWAFHLSRPTTKRLAGISSYKLVRVDCSHEDFCGDELVSLLINSAIFKRKRYKIFHKTSWSNWVWHHNEHAHSFILHVNFRDPNTICLWWRFTKMVHYARQFRYWIMFLFPIFLTCLTIDFVT